MKLSEKFKTSIRLDLQSLAIFRIVTGIIILVNLTLKLYDLEAFYTDQGILPVYAWELFYKAEGLWSLHAFSGSQGVLVHLKVRN